MNGVSISSPHVHNDNSVSRVMVLVSLALLPAYAAHLWLFGWGILINADGELELLSTRKGQSLIQRLKPLDTVD